MYSIFGEFMQSIQLWLAVVMLSTAACATADSIPSAGVDAAPGDHAIFNLDHFPGVADTERRREGYLYGAPLETVPPKPSNRSSPNEARMLPVPSKTADQDSAWTVLDTRIGSRSFSSHAGAGPYKALDSGSEISDIDTLYQLRAGRLSRVPEPESWALILLGMGFIAYQLRRSEPPLRLWDLKQIAGRRS
ncbi:MAG: hypothetical protein JWM42_1650 [Burkholderia sp.]|nr:hypothetical protein [Burkholderia sp.]